MLPLALILTAVGLALLANAVLKVVHFESFVESVAHYAPTVHPRLVAVVWTTWEVTGAVLLVTPTWYRVVPAAWLLAAATGGLARRASQGATHDCGCTARARKVGRTVIRNNLALLAGLLITHALWAGLSSLGIAMGGGMALFVLALFTVGSDKNSMTISIDRTVARRGSAGLT
jgi:hypothetical protein